MPNTSIALSDHWVDFARKQVETGRFGSTSEVIREGLRMMEERERRLDALDAAIEEGYASGPARPFDGEAFRERMHQKYGLSEAAE